MVSRRHTLAVLAGIPATLFAQSPAGALGASGASGGRGRGGQFRQPDPIDFSDHTGWSELFDGKSLNGWDGNPEVWRLESGNLVAEYSSAPGTRNRETFIIWKGGEPQNFELKLEIRLEGAGADSGIQYRSYLTPPAATPPANPAIAPDRWSLSGYQFDFNFPNNFTGQVVDGGRGNRGIVSFRGQMVRTEQGKNPRLLATLGMTDELGGYFKPGDWNQVHLIARGNTLIQTINGHVMAILVDDDPATARSKGLIGLQCSGSGPVKISFRNIWLKNL